MAKKRRTKSAEFFETLATLPQLQRAFSLSAKSATRPTVTRDAYTKTQLHWLADVQAVLHDVGVGLRLLGKQLISYPARLVYLAAISAVVVIGTVSAVKIGTATMMQYGPSLSNPSAIMGMKNTGTTILDRNGVVLYQVYGAVDRRNLRLDQIPDNLKQATLATEDPEFYSHSGISWRATTRAAWQNAVHKGKVQGGSTITQQLVKNTLLTNEKSYTRKYKELLLATQLEDHYTKDQIFEMYLNTIYYGQGAYGVQAASETYFHKPAKDLTLEESALLAGLPQRPSRFDPNVNKQAAKERRDYVLDRMALEGYTTDKTAAEAKTQPIVAGTHDVVLRAPHFVFYVLQQLREQYGSDVVEKGGITVTTTLDYAKQVQAQEIVKQQVDKLVYHHSTNGALVSVDPRTGEIINMIGSVDYNAPGFGNVNVTLSELQPGSSFKPIAYATAFTKGWNGATQVDDQPLRIQMPNGEVYAPKNYDLKFRGPVLLRRALANSLNIPAVKVLQHAGINETLDMAHNLGIRPPSLTETGRYGPSLVLGGGEVRPLDMAAVYATFANDGKAVNPYAIKKVRNRFGEDITKPRSKTIRQALDPGIAYMITNILSDTEARKEEFGAINPLALSRPAAAKTGTTNDFRDNWTVGYTPELATAVWVGNNDHSAMYNVDGITGAAPIWHDYMEMMLSGTPVSQFKIPANVVTIKVCSADGGLADANDARAISEVFLAGSQPTKPCGQVRPRPTIQVIAPTQEPTPQPVAETTPDPNQQPGRGGGVPTPEPQPVPPPPTLPPGNGNPNKSGP